MMGAFGVIAKLDELGPMRVKETTPGTYLVYAQGQNAVEGTAVYQYERSGWSCEKHGLPRGSTRPDCEHIRMARRHRSRMLAA